MIRRYAKQRPLVNRRAFLRGAGGIAIGLPFLEGLPERSAWAADAAPVFTFFICGCCGVEPKRFWPSATGALGSVLGTGDKAVDHLKDHAANLLIIRGVNFPIIGRACGHAEGLVQSLTAEEPRSSGPQAQASGPSADMLISAAVNPSGTDPLTLYAGNISNGYIEERLSFDMSGNTRAANNNPYRLYQELVGVAAPAGSGSGGTSGMAGSGSTPPPPSMTDELLRRRKSAVDQVHAELTSLMNNPKVSAADRQRLDQHFTALRDVEITMMDPTGPVNMFGCAFDGIDTDAIEGLGSNLRYSRTANAAGGLESTGELHMQLVALAFACNLNRVATLQWGDGTDGTIYDVPSNESLGNWGVHHISHRVQSDAALGENATAEAAHAEIDAVRMQTLARGLNHFRDRGLADKAAVLWTNHVAEGNHTTRNVPQIIWGNAGGYFKQGEYVDAGGVQNGKLLNMFITATTGNASPNIGSSGGGEIPEAKA
jgi:hypothetical protein